MEQRRRPTVSELKQYNFRPGLPKVKRGSETFSKGGGAPLAPGADDSLLHISSVFAKYDQGQKIPTFTMKTPWKRRPRAGAAEQESPQQQQQQQRPAQEVGATQQQPQEVADTPFGASRAGAMQQGAAEGILLDQPQIGTARKPSTEVARWADPGFTPRFGQQLKEVIPISSRRL